MSPAAPASRVPDPQTPAILIVDDNVDFADSLARLLNAAGHKALAAYDGRTSIELARQFRPRVVLLDIALPGMDGYEVASEMRKLDGLESTRFIAVTGFGQKADRARSKAEGFERHLVKPVDFASLVSLLKAEMG